MIWKIGKNIMKKQKPSPFKYQSWSSDQQLLDRIDKIKFESGDPPYDNIMYDENVGQFVDKKTGQRGALTDFVSPREAKVFEPILDNLKKPNKYQNFAEQNNIRNHVWKKVIKNRQQKKQDYEGLSSSDIVVAEDKRERLKKLNKQVAATNAAMAKVHEVQKKVAEEAPVKDVPIEERISEWAKARPEKNPMKNTIFGTDTYYLRKKGI